MADAWEKHNLPTSQNGVATKLDKSQGTTHRWFTGETHPEIDTLIRIAELGHVSIDWLLTGSMPRHRAPPGSALHTLLTIWQDANDDVRGHILKTAEGQAALQGVAAEPRAQDKSQRRKHVA